MARLLYSDSLGTSREEVCGGSGKNNQCQTPFRPPPARVAQGLDTSSRAKKRSSRGEAEGKLTGHSKLSGKPH